MLNGNRRRQRHVDRESASEFANRTTILTLAGNRASGLGDMARYRVVVVSRHKLVMGVMV